MTAGTDPARRERVLSALMLGVASGAILVPLNSTMLAVALPGIMGEFGLGANDVSSLVTLYLGSVAVALPVAGSLGDRYGHRRVFLVGVIVFSVASLFAAVGRSFTLLEAARIIQAASGALVSTSAAALIRQTAPRSRQGEAFGTFDLLTSTSAALGPFIGGLLVGALGWRSIFYVAVPVALVAAASVGFLLRPAGGSAPPRAERHPLDVRGLALLALLIVAVLVAFRVGLSGVGAIAAIATLPLAAIFVAVELRTERPAVDPHLFRQRAFASAVIGVFGATVVLHGAFFIVPLLVERLLDGSATVSGIVLLGVAGVAALVAPWGGRTSDRVGRRRLVVIGSLVTAAGLAALALPLGVASVAAVGVLLGVIGLGLGLAGSPRQAAAFEAVEPDRVGMAAGTYLTGRYLGGMVGASLGGAVLGGTVTAGGVSLGFGLLAGAAVLVAIASLGLPGRNSLSRGSGIAPEFGAIRTAWQRKD